MAGPHELYKPEQWHCVATVTWLARRAIICWEPFKSRALLLGSREAAASSWRLVVEIYELWYFKINMTY